jgi:hypothetical protein
MRRFRRQQWWAISRHKTVASVALISYMLSIFGFPVAVGAPKGNGEPFPCQDLPCGCQNAEQCWRSCCCLTPEQRWAWARAHNVTPPDYAERPSGPVPNNDSSDWHGQHAVVAKCCAKKKSQAPDKPASEHSPIRLCLTTQTCQGLATLWISTGAALPPPMLSWSPVKSEEPCRCGTFTKGPSQSATPPDPPPRSVLY